MDGLGFLQSGLDEERNVFLQSGLDEERNRVLRELGWIDNFTLKNKK